MEMTRAQLLKKFDIQAETLDILLGSGLIERDFESKSGRRVIEIGKAEQFILECSRNEIHSFGYGSVSKGKVRGLRALPFHRFLILRFLTTPMDEIYDEIFQLKLLSSRLHFKEENIKKAHERFMERCPASIRKVIKKGIPAKISKSFETFLRVLDIHPFFHNPEIVEQLTYYLRYRMDLEVSLSSSSSSDEIASFFSKLLDKDIPTLAVSSYRRLFYAIHELSQEDLEAYLQIVPPQEKQDKVSALGKTITEVSIMFGMHEAADTRKVLEFIKKEAEKEIINHMGWKTTESRQAQRSALDVWIKAMDQLEKYGGESSDVASIFEKFAVKKKEQEGGIVTMAEIQKEKRAQGS